MGDIEEMISERVVPEPEKVGEVAPYIPPSDTFSKQYCNDDISCPESEVCFENVCRSESFAKKQQILDDSSFITSVSGKKDEPVLMKPMYDKCITDDDCVDGKLCNEGKCMSKLFRDSQAVIQDQYPALRPEEFSDDDEGECDDNTDCGDDEVCNDTTGFCEAEAFTYDNSASRIPAAPPILTHVGGTDDMFRKLKQHQKIYLLYKFANTINNKIEKPHVVGVGQDKLKILLQHAITFYKTFDTLVKFHDTSAIEPLYYAIHYYYKSNGKEYTIKDHMVFMSEYNNCPTMIYNPYVMNKGVKKVKDTSYRGFVKKNSVIGKLIASKMDDITALDSALKSHYKDEYAAYVSLIPKLFIKENLYNSAVVGTPSKVKEFTRHYAPGYNSAQSTVNKKYVIYLSHFKRWKFHKSSNIQKC